MGERPWNPPRYEHKSGMIIPRYANTGVLCASGTCLAPTEAERRKLEKVLENPQVIKTPVVRNGKQATLGYQPDVWKGWN